MKTVMEAIKARRSIRSYQDKPLPKKVVNDILEAAKYAPTARNMQELEYKVITGKVLMDKLCVGIAAAMQKEGMSLKSPPGGKPNFFYSAPLLIIITAPKDNMFAATDSGIAAENIMLYATSIDLGSCFIGMAKLIERDKNLLKMVRIADNMTIVAAIICGYPAEDPAPKEKTLKAEFIE
jgi:nitroreductase